MFCVMRKFEILSGEPLDLESEYTQWSSGKNEACYSNQVVRYRSWRHIDDKVLKLRVDGLRCDELRCVCYFNHSTGGGVFKFSMMRK